MYWFKSDNSICSIELNIHQRILTDIASNDDGIYAQKLISSKVQTRAVENEHPVEHPVEEVDKSERVYMVC